LKTVISIVILIVTVLLLVNVQTTLLEATLTVQNPSRIAVVHQNSHSNTNIVSISGTNSSGTKLAIINFDDGYKSQLINAKPILDKYGFKASFFIVCNFVGKSANEFKLGN
jgi:peptidoglycan/xylan/chitin deacetylase (PgdA/CDA1 family)